MASNTQEYEVVSYERIPHVKVFVNKIRYRNYHMHGAFELLLVLEGTGRMNLKDQSIALTKGSFVIVNSGEMHEIDAKDGALVGLFIQISRHFLKDYIPYWKNLMFYPVTPQDASFSHATPQDANFSHVTPQDENTSHDTTGQGNNTHMPPSNQYDNCQKSMLQVAKRYFSASPGEEVGFLSSILILLQHVLETLPHEILSPVSYERRKKKNQRIQRIQDYLDENYLSPIRLKDLADLEGLTTTHISHLFTEYYGISFQEYLNNLRYEKAMMLLRTAHLSQEELAQNAGFSDPKYLNQMIQKRTGHSLREYQRILEQFEENPAALGGEEFWLEYIYSSKEALALLNSLEDGIF